VIGCC